MSADGASSWCGTLLSTCDDTDTGAGKPFSERRGRGSEAASTTGMPGRRWGERWGGTEDAFGFRRSKEDDLGPVFATPLLISCTPHFWIRKWRVGKEGLARVFAVRIQGSRTHFSNLAVPAPLRSIWWSIQGSQMTTTLCYGYAFVRASVSDASTCPSLSTAGGWQLPVFRFDRRTGNVTVSRPSTSLISSSFSMSDKNVRREL